MAARKARLLVAAPCLAFAAALLSSCRSQNIQACKAAYTKDLQEDWQVDRKLWDEDCAAGRPAAGIRKAAEMAFWRRCQTRFGPAVAAKLVKSDELKSFCLTPDGARYLEARWKAGDQPAAAPPKKAAPVSAAVVAASTSAAEVSPSTAAAEMAVSTQTAPAAPKIEPWVQPHPGRPLPADLPALRPPFDALARLIVKTADVEDAWTAVSALKRGKPYLILDGSRAEPYGLVVPVPPEGWIVTLTLGYVESPIIKGRLGTSAQTLAKQMERLGLGGKPLPLAAVNPLDAQRKLLVSKPGEPRRYGYPDGSVRVEYTSGQLAATLLHELTHVDRRLDGGGAARPLDERDAQQAQCRLLFRFGQADSGFILDAPTRDFLSRCERKRALVEADLLNPYADIPQLGPAAAQARAGDPAVDQRLGRKAAAFQQAWRKRIAQEYVGRYKQWLAGSPQDLAILPPAEASRQRAQREQLNEQIREDPWPLILNFDWTKPFRPPYRSEGN